MGILLASFKHAAFMCLHFFHKVSFGKIHVLC